jgi:mannose-6-phosphate isomerase-like protein (cupin superfamily)
MKTRLLAFLALALLANRVAAADATPPGPPPTDAVVIDHAKVDDAFAKGLPILLTSSYKIQTGRRVVPGKVEIHDRDTDIFYILEGAATFTTGGTPNGAKPVRPGETSADTITGGTARKLTKGDVVVVPAGVPHWFNEVSGTFLYFVVKVTK